MCIHSMSLFITCLTVMPAERKHTHQFSSAPLAAEQLFLCRKQLRMTRGPPQPKLFPFQVGISLTMAPIHAQEHRNQAYEEHLEILTHQQEWKMPSCFAYAQMYSCHSSSISNTEHVSKLQKLEQISLIGIWQKEPQSCTNLVGKLPSVLI